MPELPEVEVIRLMIEPVISGKVVDRVVVRNPNLRWPVPRELQTELPGQTIERVERRGKYLLFFCPAGTAIVHLGMTGDLRIVPAHNTLTRHDHLDIVFTDDLCLRFNDPRRFGSFHWVKDNPLTHPLLQRLGPEPLMDAFTGEYLFQRSRGKKISVKALIMDGAVVSGVGNVYANEALFSAGIHPAAEARAVSLIRFRRLADAVKKVLVTAIENGLVSNTEAAANEKEGGYFPLKINIYGRAAQPCLLCGTSIKQIRQQNRSSWFCPKCQK